MRIPQDQPKTALILLLIGKGAIRARARSRPGRRQLPLMPDGSQSRRKRKGTNSQPLERAIFSVKDGARYYSPDTGRWLNRDPIGEAGGLAIYCHTANSPPNAVDPNGESCILAALVFGTVVTGVVVFNCELYVVASEAYLEGDRRARRLDADDLSEAALDNEAVRRGLRKIHSFGVRQAYDIYVYSPIAQAGGEALTGALEIRAIIRRGQIRGVAFRITDSRAVMEDLGYRWIPRRTDVAGGYFKRIRTPDAPVNPRGVNQALRDEVEAVLRQMDRY